MENTMKKMMSLAIVLLFTINASATGLAKLNNQTNGSEVQKLKTKVQSETIKERQKKEKLLEAAAQGRAIRD
jgi:hypothetical protein